MATAERGAAVWADAGYTIQICSYGLYLAVHLDMQLWPISGDAFAYIFMAYIWRCIWICSYGLHLAVRLGM